MTRGTVTACKMARTTETRDEVYQTSACQTVDQHGTRYMVLAAEAWHSSENYYMGHEGDMQKRGHDGPQRPISMNHGQNGLSHAHMAHWSRWNHQMAALMQFFKSGPRQDHTGTMLPHGPAMAHSVH